MTPPRLQLEHMRWPEIRERIDAGARTVVFACGAVEQHGPHLPLFVDAEHGTRLACEVADRMGDALVAPTLRIGCSEHHLAFAGSLSIRPSTFVALLEDMCASVARHGFTRVRIVPSHGGNFGPLEKALPTLAAASPELDIRAFTDLRGLIRLWKRVVQEHTGFGTRVGGHADIAETAIMMALHPNLVRDDLAEEGLLLDPETADFSAMIQEGFDTVTPNGILGDARGATSELGEALLTALADFVAESFEGSA